MSGHSILEPRHSIALKFSDPWHQGRPRAIPPFFASLIYNPFLRFNTEVLARIDALIFIGGFVQQFQLLVVNKVEGECRALLLALFVNEMFAKACKNFCQCQEGHVERFRVIRDWLEPFFQVWSEGGRINIANHWSNELRIGLGKTLRNNLNLKSIFSD